MTAVYRPAIMSASLGRAWLHDFDAKVQQAARDGFQGLEVFYEDLDYLARKLSGNDNPTPEQLLQAAEHIQKTCASADLEIIGLQPFLFYEGLLDREQHDRLIEKIKLWFRIAKKLGTNTIQIPGNFLSADQLTGDREAIAADLRELADLGLREDPPVRFAYENLCWSTHVDTWEAAWDICRRVDRDNFGLCLDTFNIAGRVWADPASASGTTGPDADTVLHASLEALVREVDVRKVFYIQVVDAERMESPLVPGHPFHVDAQPARMSWSRNARTFAYETDRGAYLPVESVAKAIIDGLGYRGWVSMELFSRTMAEEGSHVPGEHSARGMVAWRKLEERLKLNQ
ncbi:xylose isomerase-like protein [Xylariales sp. PMI_506]|nr:xylose isomerase-like protein [Xylariales sp. PMI_506]